MDIHEWKPKPETKPEPEPENRGRKINTKPEKPKPADTRTEPDPLPSLVTSEVPAFVAAGEGEMPRGYPLLSALLS